MRKYLYPGFVTARKIMYGCCMFLCLGNYLILVLGLGCEFAGHSKVFTFKSLHSITICMGAQLINTLLIWDIIMGGPRRYY